MDYDNNQNTQPVPETPDIAPETQQPTEPATQPTGRSRCDAFLTTVSNILSAVFSPLLVPTYGFILVMWISYLALLPEKGRFIACGVIFLITAIVPLSAIIFMMRRGIISDAAISKPSERGIPYLITIVCYLAAALVLKQMPSWLYMFFVGAAVAAMVDSIINVRWKISAHATALGGLCGGIFFIGVQGMAVVIVMPWLIAAILLSGMVGAARIYLGRHTPGQVFAGWIVGAVMSFGFMLI